MAKVLVVDDQYLQRLRVCESLSRQGHECLEAESGLVALERYRESRPDGVIMDISMPEMDGLTALGELRSYDPNVRVAIVSAVGSEGAVLMAMQSGAIDFVVKPYTEQRLRLAVERLLAEP